MVHPLQLQCETSASAVLAGHFLHYALLGILSKVFKQLEAKISTVIHCDQATHPLLNQKKNFLN